jgi:tetratricopeptide (TPR) repeat protein
VLVLGLVSVGTLVLKNLFSPTPKPPPQEGTSTTPQPALPLPDKPSIVVLPFDNMSKDPEQDYFSNGITEVLTSDLSRISSLFVIARNTAFTYKGKAINVHEVRKELGVRYVLEADVGTAYAVAGRYEEARAPLQRDLSRYPNFLPAHLMLAVVYSEVGQAAEARAEAAEVLRLNPQFSLEVYK